MPQVSDPSFWTQFFFKDMKLKQVVVNAAGLKEQWAGIPGIERTPGGRLFVTCFSGGKTEPAPENFVYLCHSDDGGRTFSSGWKAALPKDGARAYDPTPWLAPDGVLWLIFARSNPVTDQNWVCARTCAKPDAEHPQWGEEFAVGYEGTCCNRMNKPTVLSSGEWLMPVTYANKATHKWVPGGFHHHGVGISHDRGRTWKLHGAVESPGWSLESMIVERKDGSLVMYIRCAAKVIWHSISQDKGLTWSTGGATTIANPSARFHIRRLPDGDWLLINSPDPEKRTGILASLSSDEGKTWSKGLFLDEREKVSYPDATLAPDGTIYSVHDRDREGVGEIILSTFCKDDLA